MANRRLLGTCPVCDGELRVTRLTCDACGSRLEGDFPLDRFSRLSREQKEFAEVFIACRGNIREVERVMGISYPTVRSRLDDVIEALGYSVERNTVQSDERRLVLQALNDGEITAEEALSKLREQ